MYRQPDILKPGTKVRHFKYETLNHYEKERGLFTYEVIGVATHTENRSKLVIYKDLNNDGIIHARPIDLFLGKVDKEKFPNIRQENRFEIIK